MPNPTDDMSDPELIRQALAGNLLAAERLAARYRRAVLALAQRALGNADDAQDVAQETLVYAHQRLSDVRDRARFSGWLRHVTLSLCADYRRRRGTRRLGEPMTVLNEAAEETNFARRLAVREAVAHLSDNHRTTLLLHYVGGWSLDEVAAMTDTPLNTVRSRLGAGKRLLRADLRALFPETKGKSMPAQTFALSEAQTSLLHAVFPKARVLSVQADPEPWMPFTPRVRLALADGSETTVDFRADITSPRAELFAVLERLGIPGPQIVGRPTDGGSLCAVPRGENLGHWAMGGTPHRIRLATERAFEGIDRLQGVTERLQADPVGAKLERRTLTDELEILTNDARWNADAWLAEEGKERKKWLADSWFTAALEKTRNAVADIQEPLVYTHYLHFYPGSYRIAPGESAYDEPLGWPGDARYRENPLVEFVNPFGHFGDPLLGLAMVWVQDCYPFVHTGFVEQFLWRRGVSRREFAPRLAVKALQMVARDLPLARPDANGYWDGLHGWVEQALEWM